MAWILFEFETVSINSSLAYFCISQAKIETRALKAKRPGFTDERYNETSYLFENGNNNHYITTTFAYWSAAYSLREHIQNTWTRQCTDLVSINKQIYLYNESLCYFYTNWEGLKKIIKNSCRPSSPLKSWECHFYWEFSKFFADLP